MKEVKEGILKFGVALLTILSASTVLSIAAWWAVKLYNFLP